MDERSAVALVERSRTDPGGFDMLRRALDDDASTDDARSVLLRALGELARWVTTIDESAQYLEQAIEAAQQAGRRDLAAHAMLTQSGTLWLGGDVPGAMQVLEDAERDADSLFAAKIEFQRATLLGKEGQLDEAVAAYNRALPIFESAGDTYSISCTRGNRAQFRLDRGEARAARADYIVSRDGFRAIGHAVSAAAMEHNLGRVAGRMGDVAAALQHFRASETALRRLGVDPSEVQVNRAEVLLQAGLFREAEEVASETARLMHERGLQFEHGEALFVRSQALLGQLRYAEAAEAAAVAARVLNQQGRRGWALRAEVLSIQGTQTITRDSAQRCVQLARELASIGQWLDAVQACAVASRSDPESAFAALQAIPLPRRDIPLDYRLATLEVIARASAATDDRAGALQATNVAIDLGNRQRVTRGSADLRAAVSAQLDSIAQFGLGLRREGSGSWAVLHWVDRCRGGATSIPAATSAGDAERGELLAQLRAVQQPARAADAEQMPALVRDQARLQRRLIAADRRAGGRAGRELRLPRDLRSRLDRVVVVQYHRHGDRLGAVLIEGGRARTVDLGQLDAIERHVELLSRATRRVAKNIALGVADERALGAVDTHAIALAQLMLPAFEERRPIDPGCEPSPVVVIPLSLHMGVAWSLLPALATRPVTVAPTLRHWISHAGDGQSIGDVALIEGIQLAARSEIADIADVWATQSPAVLREAIVSDALDAFQRVDLIHLACHGSRRARDGRFAQLKLADGDLVSFELERLTRTPRVVVLAACEAGLLEPLPGDEAAGIATTLFGATTATVVAPVVVVPDNSLTHEIFVDVHRSMSRGLSPSEALFAAQSLRTDPAESVIARSISCFGRG